MKKKNRELFYRLIAAVAPFLVTFLLCEAVLRCMGRKPRQSVSIDQNEPVMHEYDSLLGWATKPGTYTYPSYTASEKDVHVTIWNDRSRATSTTRKEKEIKILGVGCSFTFGWAISDHETFLFKLQSENPELDFINLGDGGYGTYQSLIRLEQYFKDHENPPSQVFYFFTDHHPLRNVGSVEWQSHLQSFSRRHQVKTPFCLFDSSGQFKRHPPEAYPVWFFDQYSAFINGIKQVTYVLLRGKRIHQKERVTKELLKIMNQECIKNNTRLSVILLSSAEEFKKTFSDFFKEEKINFSDCIPRSVNDDMFVLGEGHPNGKLNDMWSQCIQQSVLNLTDKN